MNDPRGSFAPTAIVDPTAIFADELTAVWHHALVLQRVRFGKACKVGSRSEVGRGSIIGDRTVISAGVFLPPNSIIGANVFIGPNATFTDDRYPKVHTPGQPPYKAEPPIVEDHASIGAGAVILPGVRIGHHALIGAGSIITRNVEPHAIVRGQPSNITTLAEPTRG